MGIFRVSLDHNVEVFHSLLMVVNHVISLCPLVDVPDVRRYSLHTKRKWINCFLKFFQPAVRQPHVVKNVALVGNVRFVFQRLLHRLYALFVFLVCKVRQSLFIQHLSDLLHWGILC